MLPSLLLLSLPVLVSTQTLSYITTSADYNTECKTCPRSLCPNQLYYMTSESFNATCWTRGTRIIDTTLWLKSEAGCYVTEYDTLEYDGDYTTALPYCGSASEEEHLTTSDATLQYKTECRICPDIDCDIVAYLPEDTDLTLTCWADEGQVVLDDPYHYKTMNNCYVAEAGLYTAPDRDALDWCGPVPLLEMEKHFNENGTSDVNKRDALPVPEDSSVQYLINVTVGEEYAYCRSCPGDECGEEAVYEFNESVILQCLAPVENNGTTARDWWSETTDFCYVRNRDFWESPESDYYRMPLCEYFEGGDPEGDDGDAA